MISSWFTVEPYGFYHGGLMVIVNLCRGILSGDRWAVIPHNRSFDPTTFRGIQIWVVGKIPWRNIRHYDLRGDEYHGGPHLYCAFADGGTPYEGYAYFMQGEDYNWPLDPEDEIKELP